jgi:CheY-like chemotaxis protein
VEASSPGRHQGATFTVKLPILAAGTARPAPRALTTKQRDNGGRVPLRGIDRLRVLVVDDERDAREMLTALLESRGALVRGAGSAEEALEQVERWHPDAIVADIGMPGTDGYAMLSELRSRPPDRGGTIPAVALTAYARTQDRERALRAGFQAHLSKPVNPEDLLGTLEQVAGLERSTG